MVRRLLAIFASATLLAGVPAAAKPNQHAGIINKRPSSALKRFLRSYVRDPEVPTDDAYYAAAQVRGTDLTVVYLTGRYLCGSSGCEFVVLRRRGKSFETVGSIGPSHPPLRLLPTKHHGMPDFSVQVQGGGLLRGYRKAVQYDGKDYDGLSSPLHKISPEAGQLLIAGDPEFKPLNR